MEYKKNYTEEIFTAIRGWLWSNELLEYSEYCDEHSDSCFVMVLIKALKNCKDDFLSIEELENVYNIDVCDDTRHNNLWVFLVAIFGDYGVSSRFGWIDRAKECAEFLEDLIRE